MALEIKLDFDGLDSIQELLDQMQSRVVDLSMIGSDLADIVRDDVRKRFDSAPGTQTGGVAFGGVYWQELSAASFAINPSRRGKKIGVDTGELRRSATVTGSGNLYSVDGANFIFELTSQKAEEFSANRPLVYWHPELLKQISEKITDFIMEVNNG